MIFETNIIVIGENIPYHETGEEEALRAQLSLLFFTTFV